MFEEKHNCVSFREEEIKLPHRIKGESGSYGPGEDLPALSVAMAMCEDSDLRRPHNQVEAIWFATTIRFKAGTHTPVG